MIEIDEGMESIVRKYGHEKVLNRDNKSFVKTNFWKNFIQENENTSLIFDVILFQVTVLRCIYLSVWKQPQPMWSKYHIINMTYYIKM